MGTFSPKSYTCLFFFSNIYSNSILWQVLCTALRMQMRAAQPPPSQERSSTCTQAELRSSRHGGSREQDRLSFASGGQGRLLSRVLEQEQDFTRGGVKAKAL